MSILNIVFFISNLKAASLAKLSAHTIAIDRILGLVSTVSFTDFKISRKSLLFFKATKSPKRKWIAKQSSGKREKLDFVVYSGSLHRGQFVELDYKQGTLVALVTDVIKTNRYFERVESVKEFERLLWMPETLIAYRKSSKKQETEEWINLFNK